MRPAAFAMIALWLGAPAAVAQDEWSAAQEAHVQELGTNDALLGRKLRVDAKVILVSRSEIVLRDADVQFLLSSEVVSRVQSLNEGDNVRVYGELTRDRTGRRKFDVRRLEPRPDDATLFREELEKLRAAENRAGLFALAERAEAEAARSKSNAALKKLVTDVYRAAIALEVKAAAPDDPAAAVKVADLYISKLGDRQAALEWLTRAFNPGSFPPPEIEKRLKAINAVPYASEWVLYEEMKRREGFVLRGDIWMAAERAAFLDAVEEQIRAPRRDRVTAYPGAFEEAAKKGQVLLGMVKREVAAAIGFPDDVDRVRRTVELRTRVYDAWSFEGRGQYFFEDDVLFRKP